MDGEGGNLLLNLTEALLVGVGNGVKVLGIFLDQLRINSSGEKDMGLVVFPEGACPVVQLEVKGLLNKDLLEDLLDEVGCGINEVLAELMQMLLLGIGDLLFVLLELCHHLAVRCKRFGMLK